MYNDSEILEKIAEIHKTRRNSPEMVNKIHSYIDYQNEKWIDQNDIIVLNVYDINFIEILLYKF